MERYFKILRSSVLIFALITGCISNQNSSLILRSDFHSKVAVHISELCINNGRYVGSDFEKQSAEYINKQFTEIGLQSRIENFKFESFEIEQSFLNIGNLSVNPTRLCFNPYKDSLIIKDDFVLIDTISDIDISNKYIIATEQINYFQIVLKNPKMIIYVDSLDYNKIKNQNLKAFELKINGGIKEYKSANVVANFKTSNTNDKVIILCAHYDSFLNSPGADDNASGVATILELARTLLLNSSLLNGFNITCIAFSGEEKGLLGSRHYLDTHSDQLKNCVLLINIEQAGGHGKINIEVLDSIKGIPEIKGKSQFPKYLQDKPFEGISSRWAIIEPQIFDLMSISNTPNWLVEVINESSIGINTKQTTNPGSDQFVFTQAGIVSTCIYTGGNEYHSNKDIPEQVNYSTIEQVGKLTLNIIKNTIKKEN